MLRALAAAFASVWLVACSPADEAAPTLPEPPEGAELVLELGELQVYKAFEGELCTGSLDRIERHALALEELLDMPPPRAHLILHTDQSAVERVCPWDGIRGCVRWWGAHALPEVARHELTHVFIHGATSHTRTRPLVSEGTARALDGTVAFAANRTNTLEEFEAAIAVDTQPFDRSPAAGFPLGHLFAWAIDEFGLDTVMDTYNATSKVEGATDEEFGRVLARSFGFESLAQLYADYLETHSYVYPALPETTTVLTAQELAEGVWFDTSCNGPYAEGPNDGESTTTVHLEIQDPGEYELHHEPLPLQRPSLRPREPIDEEAQYKDIRNPGDCSAAYPTRFLFHAPGYYELSYDTPLGEPHQAQFSARYQGPQCAP